MDNKTEFEIRLYHRFRRKYATELLGWRSVGGLTKKKEDAAMLKMPLEGLFRIQDFYFLDWRWIVKFDSAD